MVFFILVRSIFKERNHKTRSILTKEHKGGRLIVNFSIVAAKITSVNLPFTQCLQIAISLETQACQEMKAKKTS
ncbi:hypothetical protein VIBC2010_08213 [Vibrio caribbeanicus ATCC BAA-2122]|uniref:Uncharacterized protein n=1 Tax=Vibrio caribbeanicus ATCC BAA-2122 TaxID=796620 RepID=E3BE99_9VIBR|nr:hypothetical protein VIBC2010_08213 [Vibrio caribbeanicus ATCC BAA-2122]